jgi:hypothetical protein
MENRSCLEAEPHLKSTTVNKRAAPADGEEPTDTCSTGWPSWGMLLCALQWETRPCGRHGRRMDRWPMMLRSDGEKRKGSNKSEIKHGRRVPAVLIGLPWWG